MAKRLRALHWALSRPNGSHAETLARYHQALDFDETEWPTVDPHAEGSWQWWATVLLG